MKKIILFSLTALFVSGLSSCKKYEDGPSLSLKSKKARVAGDWVATSFKINGVDVLHTQDSTFSITCSGGGKVNYAEKTDQLLEMKTSRDGDVTWTPTITTTYIDEATTYQSCQATYLTKTEQHPLIGSWKFGNDKETLQIKTDSDVTEFEIKELREKKMKLESKLGSETISIEWKKK